MTNAKHQASKTGPVIVARGGKGMFFVTRNEVTWLVACKLAKPTTHRNVYRALASFDRIEAVINGTEK